MFITSVKSTSLNVVSNACVCCALTNRCATVRRKRDIFSLRSVRSPVATGIETAGAGSFSALGVAAAGMVAFAASASDFVIRPSLPDP